MTALLTRVMNGIHGLMSANLHNYAIATLLVLEVVCVGAVLLFPDPTRLAMAKDVGTTLLGAMTVVGGVHGVKAIKKSNGGGAAAPDEGSGRAPLGAPLPKAE